MIKTLARSLKGNKAASITTVGLSALEVAFEIIIPLCMSDLLDSGINAGDMSKVWIYGGALLIFAVFELIT
ncbi:MAG: ABC transporter ATP-binding protein, partial [Bacilli bacterium]